MATQWTFLAVVGLSLIQMSYQQDCPQDVVFIVDHSGSITASSPTNNVYQNWNLMKTFLNNLLGRMRYGVPNTQLATVTFGDNSTVAFNLTRYPSANDASNAILNLDYQNGGRSNVSGAFRTVTNAILASGNGKRYQVPSICFLIVSFPPITDAGLTPAERDRLKAICRLVILAVGDPNRLGNLRTEYQPYVDNPATDYFEAAFLTLNNTDVVTPIINNITVLCPTTPTPSITRTTTTTILPAPTASLSTSRSATTVTTLTTTPTLPPTVASSRSTDASTTPAMCFSTTAVQIGIGLGVSCGFVILLLLGIVIYLCVKNRSLSQYKRVSEKQSQSLDGQNKTQNQTAADTSPVQSSPSTEYEHALAPNPYRVYQSLAPYDSIIAQETENNGDYI